VNYPNWWGLPKMRKAEDRKIQQYTSYLFIINPTLKVVAMRDIQVGKDLFLEDVGNALDME
jgi:hypothetical protein